MTGWFSSNGMLKSTQAPELKPDKRVSSKVKVNCDYCGNELERKPSKIKEGKNYFCNSNCYGKWQSENQVGKNCPL